MLRWKEIEGFPGYKVSDKGFVLGKRGVCMKLYKNVQNGYRQVNLQSPEGERKVYVHRLVARAFVLGFREGLIVNHINGDKDDNRACNLEWVTQKENAQHAFATGLNKGHAPKPTPVVREDGEEFPSICAAAKASGVSKNTVTRALQGRQTRIKFKKLEIPAVSPV